MAKATTKKHVGVMMTGTAVAKFIVRKDFRSRTLSTDYVKGQSYTLREGNVKLADKLKEWQADEKVQIIPVIPGHQLLEGLA